MQQEQNKNKILEVLDYLISCPSSDQVKYCAEGLKKAIENSIIRRKCYPKWFKPVACVIIYNSEKEILLGKRKKGKAEEGKWGLLGGAGAFGESSNSQDFAKREVEYDIEHKVDFDNLKHFKNIIKFSEQLFTLEMYFYYNDEKINLNKEIKITEGSEAPEEVRWFSKNWVEDNKEKIAFDNSELLKDFYNEIL